MNRFFLIICFLLAIPTYAGAAGHKPVEPESKALIKSFQVKFTELDSLIFSTTKQHASPILRDKTSQPAADESDELLAEKLSSDIRYLESKNGLEVSGQVYYRLDEGFGLDEDDATSRYKGKIQAELAWSFFQSSFYKRAGKINELKIMNDLEKMKSASDRLGMFVFLQKERFRLKYDSITSGILKHRIENLNLLSHAQAYLLNTEHISSDELLNILNEKAEAERQLAAISAESPKAANLSSPTGVVIKIDSAALLSKILETQAGLSTLQLEKKLLKQQYKNTDYLQNMSATPFLRYSYYTRPDMPNSSNIDVGIRFRLPLTRETKRKRQNLLSQLNVIEGEREQLLNQITAEVKSVLNEIESMNRSAYGELLRMKELKNYLSLRKTAYENRIGEYSLLSRMKEYNIYLACWEKMLSFQYKRDCLITELQAYLTDVPVTDYCIELVYGIND